jgi:hypothetical protein
VAEKERKEAAQQSGATCQNCGDHIYKEGTFHVVNRIACPCSSSSISLSLGVILFARGNAVVFTIAILVQKWKRLVGARWIVLLSITTRSTATRFATRYDLTNIIVSSMNATHMSYCVHDSASFKDHVAAAFQIYGWER